MSAANGTLQKERPPSDLIRRVTSSFLILDAESVTGPLEALTARHDGQGENIGDATEGLRSVVSAATLPFQLTVDAIHQRRFDRFLSAERIRRLKDVKSNESLSDELEKRSADIARCKMTEFLASTQGSASVRDAVLEELDRSLTSATVSYAAKEMMNQALISTWGVFEHFAARFIVDRVNSFPHLAKAALSSPELKIYFGKPLLDLEAIGEHGYDLTRSMGSIIFRGKRLDNLGVVRSVLSTMFVDPEVRDALGGELWMLNQRRHLLVHKRGLVDREYLERTGDKLQLGQRLIVTSESVERYLFAVQRAIVAIAAASEQI